MPKQFVKRHFFARTQDLDALADLFEVSPEAMHHRLADDLRLIDPPRFTYACRGRQTRSRAIPIAWRQPARQHTSTEAEALP